MEPIFGFGEAGDPGLEFVSDAVPVDELTKRVDEDGGAAFTLMPPTFDQFVEVADRNEQMPAKATYFDPKPQSGLFLRIEEDEEDLTPGRVTRDVASTGAPAGRSRASRTSPSNKACCAGSRSAVSSGCHCTPSIQVDPRSSGSGVVRSIDSISPSWLRPVTSRPSPRRSIP